MSKLIYKGDIIENFGERLPSPYIEKIRILDDRLEVDLSIFLIDSTYGHTPDTTETYADPVSREFTATGVESMENWLKKSSEFLGTHGGGSERELRIYLACTGVTAKWERLLNPQRESILYDEFANSYSANILFSDFTPAVGELLFTEDDQRIVRFYTTLVLGTPRGSYAGNPTIQSDDGFATSYLRWADSDGTQSGTGTRLGIYAFSSLLDRDEFISDWGASDSTERTAIAAPPIRKLMQGQFSDIGYEEVLEDNQLVTNAAVYVDSEGNIYSQAPILDASGRYRKVGALTGDRIAALVEALIEGTPVPSNEDGEHLQEWLDQISTAAQTYKLPMGADVTTSYADDIQPTGVIQIVAELNAIRKAWNSGENLYMKNFYRSFRALVRNVNISVSAMPIVRKILKPNLKIIDLRTSPELLWLPGISYFHGWPGHAITDAADVPSEAQSSFIQTTAIYGAMMRGVKDWNSDISLGPYIENPDWGVDYENAISEDFRIAAKGFFFFDYERALIARSCINRLFNIKVLQRWFGKSMIQSRYLIEKVNLTKLIAETDGDVLREWDVEMYRTSGDYLAPTYQRWPVNESATDFDWANSDRSGTSYKRKSYYDLDESEWTSTAENPGVEDGSYPDPGLYINSTFASTGNDYGCKNLWTPNRWVNPDGGIWKVGTPPLPLPKLNKTNKMGFSSEPNLFGSKLFPGAWNIDEDQVTSVRAKLVPRNLGVMNHGIPGLGVSSAEYGQYPALAQSVVRQSDTSLDLKPFGYRMACFEWGDVYQNSQHWYEKQWLDETINHNVRVTIKDFTLDIALSLMDTYLDVVTGPMADYVSYATEYCAYNNIDDRFTPSFADAITAHYMEASISDTTPWIIGPLVYFMHRDLLFREFGGGTEDAIRAVYQAANAMAAKINPYQGTLSELMAFRDMMQSLYDVNYGTGGALQAEITSGALTVPYEHVFEQTLEIDYDRTFPIDVTQQVEIYPIPAPVDIPAALEAPHDFCRMPSASALPGSGTSARREWRWLGDYADTTIDSTTGRMRGWTMRSALASAGITMSTIKTNYHTGGGTHGGTWYKGEIAGGTTSISAEWFEGYSTIDFGGVFYSDIGECYCVGTEGIDYSGLAVRKTGGGGLEEVDSYGADRANWGCPEEIRDSTDSTGEGYHWWPNDPSTYALCWTCNSDYVDGTSDTTEVWRADWCECETFEPIDVGGGDPDPGGGMTEADCIAYCAARTDGLTVANYNPATEECDCIAAEGEGDPESGDSGATIPGWLGS